MKLESRKLPIKTLPSGDQLTITVYEITGEKPGPHCYLQSSVHGAELQGNVVIAELMDYFTNHSFNGKVTFIPMANPMAINNKMIGQTFGRFNPVTGTNWNRSYLNIELDNYDLDDEQFRSALIEKCEHKQNDLNEDGKLHATLLKEALKADIVLDLHTGPLACDYIYTPNNRLSEAKELLFENYISIPAEFAGAMDEATFCPWQKREELTKRPNPISSYTIELGSEEVISKNKAKKQTARLLNFLAHIGMVEYDEEFESSEQRYSDLKDFKTLYAPQTGLFEYIVDYGQLVNSGEKLGEFLTFSSDGPKWTPMLADTDMIIINAHQTANVTEGCELFQVLTNYKTL